MHSSLKGFSWIEVLTLPRLDSFVFLAFLFKICCCHHPHGPGFIFLSLSLRWSSELPFLLCSLGGLYSFLQLQPSHLCVINSSSMQYLKTGSILYTLPDCWMVVIGLSNVFSKLSKVTSPCTLKLVATCQGTEYLVVTYLPACSSLLTSEVSPEPSYLPQTCPLLFERNPNYKVPRYVRSMCCDTLSLGLLCVSTLILSIQVTLFKKSWVHFCKARPCCYVAFREAFSWQSFQTSHIYSFKI